MEYEGQICRPPMERGAYKLPVAVGCSYNQCKFCTLFKHLSYRELPMEQIEAELSRVKSLGGNPSHAFLGDGNPFGLPTSRLLELLSLIRRYLPRCTSVSMDATITNIREKSDAELRRLYEQGVDEVYVGIECGNDDVLEFMKKDHNSKEAYRELSRLKQSGIAYSAHIMTGLAGEGRGLESAENTARFLNQTHPKKIINTAIFLSKRAPLYREIEAGRWKPSSHLENLREERRLIELLDTEVESYDGLQDPIEVRTRGSLPRDKEKMLEYLDRQIRRLETEGEPPVPIY